MLKQSFMFICKNENSTVSCERCCNTFRQVYVWNTLEYVDFILNHMMDVHNALRYTDVNVRFW